MSNRKVAKKQLMCHSLLNRQYKAGYASNKEITLSIKFGKALNKLSTTEYKIFLQALHDIKYDSMATV